MARQHRRRLARSIGARASPSTSPSIAGDLAAKGFDEVQLDYIRFFSDGPYAAADTNLPNTQSFRLPAIQRVLRVVSEELDATRTFLGADVFPISFIVPDDQGIGQRPEVIMPYVDYFCPMVYPSHYGPGVFGFAVPERLPLRGDRRDAPDHERAEGGAAGGDPPLDPGLRLRAVPALHRGAGARPRCAAAADNGAQGWMIWNARARSPSRRSARRARARMRARSILRQPQPRPAPSPSASALTRCVSSCSA